MNNALSIIHHKKNRLNINLNETLALKNLVIEIHFVKKNKLSIYEIIKSKV